MGEYYGVRGADGELIAMGGQRLMLDGYAEISGLCAHPEHRGKGLATRLIWELVRRHRRNGLRSFLHVTCANENAIRLYLELGFQDVRTVVLHQLRLRG
jgi:predicted GNAT family acetyltransferase